MLNRFNLGQAPQTLNAVVLDDNEQQHAVSMTMECFAEVETISGELSRATDIALGLENLEFVTRNVSGSKNTDLAFIDTAVGLAVAGSDVSTEELLPSLESNDDGTISTEAIKNIAKSVWDAIKNAVLKMWRKIAEFWKWLTDSVPGVRKAAVKLRDRAEASVGKSTDKSKVELGREIFTLSVDENAPSSGSDIASGLGKLLEVTNAVYNEYAKGVVEAGVEQAGIIDKFRVDTKANAELDIQALIAASEMGTAISAVSRVVKDAVGADTRFVDTKDMKKVDLLGNESLFLTSRHITAGRTVLEQAAASRKIRLELKNTKQKPGKAKESGSISIITPEEVIGMADSIIELCDGIIEYNKSSNFKKAEDAGDKMKKATDGLESTYKSASKDEDFDNEIKPYYNSALSFNTAFVRLNGSTQLSLTKHVVAVSRAAMTACSKSLSLHKD